MGMGLRIVHRVSSCRRGTSGDGLQHRHSCCVGAYGSSFVVNRALRDLNVHRSRPLTNEPTALPSSVFVRAAIKAVDVTKSYRLQWRRPDLRDLKSKWK
jgi:hypothetical protein